LLIYVVVRALWNIYVYLIRMHVNESLYLVVINLVTSEKPRSVNIAYISVISEYQIIPLTAYTPALCSQ